MPQCLLGRSDSRKEEGREEGREEEGREEGREEEGREGDSTKGEANSRICENIKNNVIRNVRLEYECRNE